MYKRMLDKKNIPTEDDFLVFMCDVAPLFTILDSKLYEKNCTKNIDFPYGNNYGWCNKYYLNKKLICNIFPESNAFCVMIRLSNKQINSLSDLSSYTVNCIDNKYPCSDGGWIYYRVCNDLDLIDILKILKVKLK